MNSEQLYNAITDIRDDLVTGAENHRLRKPRRTTVRRAALAAAIVLIAAAGSYFAINWFRDVSPVPPPDNSPIPVEPSAPVDTQVKYQLLAVNDTYILLSMPLTQNAGDLPLEQNADGHYLIPGENVTPISFADPAEFNAITGDAAAFLTREMYTIDLSAYFDEYNAVNVLRVSGGGYDYVYQPGELSHSLRNPDAELPSRYIFEYGFDLFSFDTATEELKKITRDTTGDYNKADFLSIEGMDTFGARWAQYPVPDDSGRYVAFSSNRRDYMRWYNNQNEIFAVNDVWIHDFDNDDEYLLLENAEPQCWIDHLLIYRNTADEYSIYSYNMITGEKKKVFDGYSLPSRVSKDTFIAETVITEEGAIIEIKYQIINMATGELNEIDTKLNDYYLWRSPVFSQCDNAAYQTYRYQPDRQVKPDIDKFVIVKTGRDNRKTVYELPDSLDWEWSVEVTYVLGENQLLVSIDDGKEYAIIRLAKKSP